MGTILFFDDWPLAQVFNVRRFRGRPKWIPEATLEDSLTEGTWNFPFVWFDEETDSWKALYCAALHDGGRHPDGFLPRTQALMYAESADGQRWTKPDVRNRTNHVPNRVADNQVFGVEGHIDGAPVFLDQEEPDKEKRFKYLFSRNGRQGLAVSPDGLRWRILAEELLGNYTLDSPITCFFNHYRQGYCVSRRLHNGDRRIAFMETRDWKTFSDPEIIIHPDPEDPPLIQFYGMPVFRYESLYLGLLWRLHCHPTDEIRKGIGGPIDCALVYSLDGWRFNRATHDAFIERPERGEHGSGCVYVSSMVVDKDFQIRFYSGGSKGEHFQDQELTDAALMLHTLRLDGFFGLESYVMRGRFMTRSVMFSGTNFRINARAPHGQVRVQLSRPESRTANKPVDGMSFHDCVPFQGDDLFWTPCWSSGKTLADLRPDERYHIEVELTNAEIYAIRGDFQMNYGSGTDQAPVTYKV